jgi:hypothetical protein
VLLNDWNLGNDHKLVDWVQISAHKNDDGDSVFLIRFNIKECPSNYPPQGETPSLGFSVDIIERLHVIDDPKSSARFDVWNESLPIRLVNKHFDKIIH